METVYSISKNIVIIDDGQVLLTYGIVAADRSGNRLSEFPDVSVNRSFTERVVKLLNGCRVEHCHFFEVVTDELNR